MNAANRARRSRGRAARSFAWILVSLGVVLLLAAPLAHTFGLRFAVISGGSMAPTILRGDVLVIGPAPDRLNVDDLAVVGLGDVAYVHRVVHAENNAYVLQGDANAEPDLRRVPHGEITGQVVHRIAAPLALPAAATISDEGKIGIAFGSISLVLWATLSGRFPLALSEASARSV